MEERRAFEDELRQSLRRKKLLRRQPSRKRAMAKKPAVPPVAQTWSGRLLSQLSRLRNKK